MVVRAGQMRQQFVSETPDPVIERFPARIESPSLSASEEARLQSDEQKQELKWLQALGPEYDPKTGQLVNRLLAYSKSQARAFESLVLKGVPNSFRARVWFELLDEPPEARRRPMTPLATLVDRATPRDDRLIRLDMPRVLAAVAPFYRGTIRENLYRILRGYANLDAEVGFVIGMAFSAGLLLAYMDESRAWQAFEGLMRGPGHEMRFFFMGEFVRVKELNKVWEWFLVKKYPKVHARLRQLGLDPMRYTPDWFCMGFQSIPFPANFSLILFDRFLAFGSRALLSFALTIIDLLKKFFHEGTDETCQAALQNPTTRPEFADWRVVLKKYNEKFISASDYEAAFTAVGLKLFP